MHTVKRTGQLPLSFEGEVVAESDGRYHNGKDQNRWHEVTVYKTKGGNYVLHIGYRTLWEGESARDMAEHFAEPEDMQSAIAEYDPTGPVVGFPPGEQYAEKQSRLHADIRRRFGGQVTEIYDSLGFSEHID